MADIMNVMVSRTEIDFSKPINTVNVTFSVDRSNIEEYRAFLDVAVFLLDHGLNVYTKTNDGFVLNLTRAYNEMKNFKERIHDGE